MRVNRWFSRLSSEAHYSRRLIFFPYAGGDAPAIYRKWVAHLPCDIDLWAVHLPGRGCRSKETPVANISELAMEIADVISSQSELPFALFGHSMGALLILETSKCLGQSYGIEPTALFVSGCKAPHLGKLSLPNIKASDKEIIDELRRLNGTPPEILDHQALMSIMLRTIRADFEACDRYVSTNERVFSCPITAFGGRNDEITKEQLEAWSKFTRGQFSLFMMDGDHFFLNGRSKEIAQIITHCF